MQKLVEDVLLDGGLRRMRWMDDAPLRVREPDGYEVEASEDTQLGIHYLTVTCMWRGPCEIRFPWPVSPASCPIADEKMIRMLAWAINGEKVSKCMGEGAAAFAGMVGRWPRVAYIKKLPEGAEHGVEIAALMLLEVDWVLPGFLFIGG